MIVVTNYLINFIFEVGKFSKFIFQTIYWFFLPPFYIKEMFKSIRSVSLQCIVPVIAVVTPAGMVITLQGLKVFDLFGVHRLLSSLLAEAVFREISPILASIMVAAQAGSAIAGEIGTMRVEEEIDALEAMSVNPFQYIIIPKLLGLAFACPLLNIFASVCGLFGGFIVAVGLKGLNKGVFIDNLFSFLQVSHIFEGMIKASIFGLIIGFMSCYKGYNVTGGALGVGKAANNTVVYSVLLMVIVNYFITSIIIKIF